ncbi:hypothetical protein H0H87_005472 [Tephrocybe sp. NHM501043]|nr:hypothetical protein H0H87_005472 [Tephrocybe sp. NHM501043]
MSSFTPKEINQAYFNAVIFEALMRGTGPKRGGQSRVGMTIVVNVLFILATADLGAFWAYVRRAFIAHGDTSQTIADALNEYPTWFTAMISFSDANALVADSVIIWRTWVIWGRNWKITVVPIICTMLTLAFSIIAIFQTVTGTTFGVLGVDYATALYSTTLATTVICTAAIVYRVVAIGGFRSYSSIIEILVQSAVLYCIATLFALIAYIVNGPASEYASAFWTACTGIAPTLVVARVAAGQAGPKQVWPWDNDSGVHSSQNPLVSLPRFSHGTRGMLSTQTHVNTSTITRTFHDQDTSVDSNGKPGLLNEFYKSKEVV